MILNPFLNGGATIQFNELQYFSVSPSEVHLTHIEHNRSLSLTITDKTIHSPVCLLDNCLFWGNRSVDRNLYPNKY